MENFIWNSFWNFLLFARNGQNRKPDLLEMVPVLVLPATATRRAAKLVASSLLLATAAAAFGVKRYPPKQAHHLLQVSPSSSSSIPPSFFVASLQDRFRVGDYHIWLYRERESRSPTSWERYKVVRSDDGIVVVEMATKFSDKDAYLTHHRMSVDLAAHLEASNHRDDWRLTNFEFYQHGNKKWTNFGVGDNVQAFEEKYDIFSMLHPTTNKKHDDSSLEIRLVQVDEDSSNYSLMLTRTGRHAYTGAWYCDPTGPHSHLSGVALLKDFEEHSFSLIESGRVGENAKYFDVKV